MAVIETHVGKVASKIVRVPELLARFLAEDKIGRIIGNVGRCPHVNIQMRNIRLESTLTTRK